MLLQPEAILLDCRQTVFDIGLTVTSRSANAWMSCFKGGAKTSQFPVASGYGEGGAQNTLGSYITVHGARQGKARHREDRRPRQAAAKGS